MITRSPTDAESAKSESYTAIPPVESCIYEGPLEPKEDPAAVTTPRIVNTLSSKA